MKKQVLISLISIISIFQMNAQWNNYGDNFLSGNLMLKNYNNTTGAGNQINFTSFGDEHPGPRIKSSLSFASGGDSRSSLILSSYWGGYKDELILSNGNVAIGSSITNSTLSIRNSQLANDAPSGSVDLSFYTNDSPIGIGTKISAYKETFNTAGIAFFTQWGWVAPIEKMRISANGNVGIGTVNPSCKLDVCGTIRANEVKVDLAGGCDFVFTSDYKLRDLKDLEQFVKTNQHLPEVASEKEMIENGVNMKELQMKLLQKIEELTLYMIDQNKKIEALQNEIKAASK